MTLTIFEPDNKSIYYLVYEFKITRNEVKTDYNNLLFAHNKLQYGPEL